MNIRIVVQKTDGSQLTETKLLGFSFRKNTYLPYTLLNVRISADSVDFENSAEVFMYINENLIHHGLIDSLKTVYSGGSRVTTVISRGFTSLLCQNQIEPGMKLNITFNQLMNSYYELPHVTHEDNSTQGYIFVSGKTSMWDGVVNLSYKFCGTYPYIRDTNCVRITPVSDPAVFSYTNDQLLSQGFAMNGRRRISHFHMADMGGNYGIYENTDNDAVSYGILRHKYIELDKEFLYDPDNALTFRSKVASRQQKVFFCTYSGYNGEDLSDIVSFGSIISQRIEGIEIKGTSDGVITELSVYQDKF